MWLQKRLLKKRLQKRTIDDVAAEAANEGAPAVEAETKEVVKKRLLLQKLKLPKKKNKL
jgi:hypothetical protein